MQDCPLLGRKARLERCESGRIGLTANELTWETGSEGSNPSLSARKSSRSLALGSPKARLWPLFRRFGVERVSGIDATRQGPPGSTPRGCAGGVRQTARADRAASDLGSQHVELAARRGRVEAMLDQPAGCHQASPRPPGADHLEVDLGAVAGDDVA